MAIYASNANNNKLKKMTSAYGTTWEFQYPSMWACCVVDNIIFKTDWINNRIDAYNAATGGFLYQFNTAVGSPRGITSDGTYLYIVYNGADRIEKRDLVGNIVTSNITLGLSLAKGCTTDGVSVWIANGGGLKSLIKVNAQNLVLLASTPNSYYPNVSQLTTDRTNIYFWCTNITTPEIGAAKTGIVKLDTSFGYAAYAATTAANRVAMTIDSGQLVTANSTTSEMERYNKDLTAAGSSALALSNGIVYLDSDENATLRKIPIPSGSGTPLPSGSGGKLRRRPKYIQPSDII